MKIYDGQAPNPWRVRVFLAEKGVEIPMEAMQVLDGSTRTEAFRKINSLGELPVLELDDGRILTESVAICRYLESEFPKPTLMGRDAFEQAYIEMWSRRMELQLVAALANVGLHTIPFFDGKIEQMPDYAASQRRAAAKKWAWFDQEMSDGRPFVTGDQFTLADITGMMAVKITDIVEEPMPANLEHAKAWEQRVRARDSWSA
ncbi:MAG: glutathione S-transferase family protein [Pseudomonadota bacterium]